MKILLHADGGAGVGLGHASRCSALVGALQRRGYDPSVLVEPDSGLGDYLAKLKVPVIQGKTGVEDFLAIAYHLHAVACIVDSYRWATRDLVAIRTDRRPVIVFDDDAKRDLPVDAIINGAPSAEQLKYRNLPITRHWLGLRYQVIREDFRDIPLRRISNEVRRIIVLMGGDDLMGNLPSLSIRLNAIAEKAHPTYRVQIICGPYARIPDVSGLTHLELSQSPPNLRDLMLQADLAISAGGQTLYELACCGTPTIACCTGEDQVNNIIAMSRLGIVMDSGRADRPEWLDVVESAIGILDSRPERRAAMSKAAQSLIDGRGADRVAEALEILIQEKNGEVPGSA
jgi:UDP-2,4-diacetamido-2,4,6-trideoxy-beta-L-altropyranose hydrolase